MPPIDQAWLTDQLLDIARGISRVETRLDSFSQEVGEVKVRLLGLPCGPHGSTLARIEEILGRTDRERGWRRKIALVALAAVLSVLGGLATITLQEVLERKVEASPTVQEVTPKTEPVGALDPTAPDAYDALTTSTR